MLAVLRIGTAPEAAVGLDQQMLALPVMPAFRAGRATGLDAAVAEVPDLLEFGQNEAHRNFTPLNPRWLLSLRLMSCRLVTP